MYGLDTTHLSIEAAWEHSQHHQHTLNHPQHAHHRLETPSSNQNFQFGYSAAFPQYTIPPLSPSTSSVTSSASSSGTSSASLPSPISPLGLSSADLIMRRSFGFNANNTSAQGMDVPACLPTHQLFDFDFSASFAERDGQVPPSPTNSIGSGPLASPTSPAVTSVPSSIAFPPSDTVTSSSNNSPSSTKRPSAAAATNANGSKKPRACMSTKDFVPPDVTGLSKREARLVKNRAAAFLSRQRKREEFELMEIRVSELEQENARLKAVIEGRSPPPSPSSSSDRASSSPAPSSSNEVEQLRAQLAAARQRENDLAERLERVKYQAQQAAREQAKEREELERARKELRLGRKDVVVKEEESDATSSGASTPLMGPVKNLMSNPKSGASLGLMVLLCAIPSLLSPTSSSSSTLPNASSFFDIHTAPSTGFDAPSVLSSSSTGARNALDWEFDWAGRPRSRPSAATSPSKMDVDNLSFSEESSEWKKLEFEADDAREIFGLGSLDISFDTRRTKDGKVRVRIHSSPTVQQQSILPKSDNPALPASSLESDESEDPLGPFLASASAQGHASSLLSGINLGFGGLNNVGINMGSAGMPDFGFGAEFPFASSGAGLPTSMHSSSSTLLTVVDPKDSNDVQGSRKRVRIALKNLPRPGHEGGEWEVELQ